MTMTELLADQIDVSRDWTLKLIADLAGDDWTHQPAPGLQHALWLCGHLAVAEHLLVITRCVGGDPPDAAFAKHFGIGCPVSSSTETDWPSPQSVVDKMAETHAEVLGAVREMPVAKLDEPCYGQDGAVHPHYKTVAGALAHCARHESFHAGQIATIRRLLGKPFLR
jgi:uncharacterized damage-inducible protein DinB